MPPVTSANSYLLLFKILMSILLWSMHEIVKVIHHYRHGVSTVTMVHTVVVKTTHFIKYSAETVLFNVPYVHSVPDTDCNCFPLTIHVVPSR